MKWTLMDPEEASKKSKSFYEIKTDLVLVGNGNRDILHITHGNYSIKIIDRFDTLDCRF
jgi:hypothetical protein